MTPTKNLLAKIKVNIHEESEDTFRNHLFSQKYVVYGEFNYTSFKLWKKTSWTGSFYYVVMGKVTKVGDKVNVDLKTKMNAAGKVIRFVMFWTFFLVLVFGVLLQEDNSFEFLWKRGVLVALALLLPAIVFRYGWRIEKRVFLKEVRALLKSA